MPGRTLLLLLPLLLGGCLYSREITHIRNDVASALEVSFDREFVIVIGPRTFHGLGWFARRIPDSRTRMAGDLLAHVDRIKVGVYRAAGPAGRGLTVSDLPRLRDSDWQVAVRTREDDASVWVMYRERHTFVRDMLVLSLEGDELVIVRLEGRLDALLEQAVADAAVVRDLTALGDR